MPAAAARARAATRPAPRRTKSPARPRRAARARRALTPSRGIAAPGLIPAAVGRVGELADSGLVVRMTRSRAWIAVLGLLLAGIVTLNVLSLNFTASSGRLAARSEGLARENAVLRAELTENLSGPRIEAVALANGLLVPAPREIGYLSAGDQYAQVAARRIEQGLLTTPASAPPIAPLVEPAAETVVPTLAPEAPPTTPPPAP
jgi:hypothetical protein